MNKKKLWIICASLFVIYLFSANFLVGLTIPSERALSGYAFSEIAPKCEVYAALTDSQYASDAHETMLFSGWVVAPSAKADEVHARIILKGTRHAYASSAVPLSSNAQVKQVFGSAIDDASRVGFSALVSTLTAANDVYDICLEVAISGEVVAILPLNQSFEKDGINMTLATKAKRVEQVDAQQSDDITYAVNEQTDMSRGAPVSGWAYFSDGRIADDILAEFTFADGSIKVFELAQISSLNAGITGGNIRTLNSAFNTMVPKDELLQGNSKVRLILSSGGKYYKTGIVVQFENQ